MRNRGACIVLGLAIGLGGCAIQVGESGKAGYPGDLRIENESVEKSGAEMVRVEIGMGAGDLNVEGGATKLMEARFEYNVPEWKPEVRYDATGFRGRLLIKQGSGTAGLGHMKNRWDIKLANDVPADLDVSCGAGESRIDLRGMLLRSVQVKMGAGQVDLDLRSEHARDFDVRVEGGVGEATVRVPSGLGVIAEARGGIGEINVRGMRKDGGRWVTEAYGKAKTTIRLNVKGGIGQINIIAD